MRLAVISIEPWDEVWRRNQHFCRELLDQGVAETILFVEPPRFSWRPSMSRSVEGVVVVTPGLLLPKRLAGLVLTGWRLRKALAGAIDVLWVNESTLGVHLLRDSMPTVYDVTDDWREFDFPSRISRRLVRAEDRLASAATTTVCSEVLAARWLTRYGVTARVIQNGVDAAAWGTATARQLDGPGPHVGYIGTLHEKRLDVDLILQIADDARVGQVHLVGPDALEENARARLRGHPKVLLHGPVPAADVPSWTLAMDVLITPHLVNDFTLSLDAIKAYEYLASGRPIVATPTSGFQLLREPGLVVAERAQVVSAVARALADPPPVRRQVSPHGWAARAQEFGAVLHEAVDSHRARGSTRA